MSRVPSVVVLSALSLLACRESAVRERPVRGGTVVIAELNAPKTLLPIVEETTLDAELNGLLYPGLTQLLWSQGRLQSTAGPLALATRWEFGSDSSTITFHLRPNALWSDGIRLTAADVRFSYELYADSTVGSPRRPYTEEILRIDTPDDTTVVFVFRRRYPQMLMHASLGVVPRHIYAAADRQHLRADPRVAEPAEGRLVVSGPFQVGTWRSGHEVVLVPNPRCWAVPRLERVVIRVIPEESTRLVELESGEVDVARLTSLEAPTRLRARSDLRIERQPMRFYDYVAWNPKAKPFFSDPQVRRALSLAIERQAILSALSLEPYATPAGGPYPPIFETLQSAEVAPDPYRPDEAAAILDRLGWWDRNGDGLRERGGIPLRFRLVTNAGNARRIAAAQMIQAQFRRIGVDVALRQEETVTFFQNLRERDFEAALGGWSVALSPELNIFRSDAEALNFVSYSSGAFDSLFRLARAQRTEGEAARFWREAARHVSRDRPYAFLWFYDMLWGVRSRVRGMKMDPLGALQNLYDWYVAGT